MAGGGGAGDDRGRTVWGGWEMKREWARDPPMGYRAQKKERRGHVPCTVPRPVLRWRDKGHGGVAAKGTLKKGKEGGREEG